MMILFFWTVVIFILFFTDYSDIKKQIVSSIWAIVSVIIFITFAFQIFVVPSGSMIPNLMIGDYIAVSKYSYGYNHQSLPIGLISRMLFLDIILDKWEHRIFYSEPKQGDVVVFKLPNNPEVYYVKRLIGLPGDRIQVVNGHLFVNDIKLHKSSVSTNIDFETNLNNKKYLIQDLGDSIYDNTGLFLVPEDHFFFMGDNRDNSLDSRDNMGMISKTNLVGKASRYMWSIRDNVLFFSNPIAWFKNLSFAKFMYRV